jgi:hypothetical protein
MVQFQDRGYWQNLSTYNFNDRARSWANRTAVDARVAEHATTDPNFPGMRRCLQPHSSSSSFDTPFIDVASAIRIFVTGTVC